MAKKKLGKKTKTALEVGGAITAAAALATAAGAIALSDRKRRTKAKKWAVNAKRKAVQNAKLATKLGKQEYAKLMKQAISRYGNLEDMTAADIMKAANDLRSEWSKVRRANAPAVRHKKTVGHQRTAKAKKKSRSKKTRI